MIATKHWFHHRNHGSPPGKILVVLREGSSSFWPFKLSYKKEWELFSKLWGNTVSKIQFQLKMCPKDLEKD